MNSLPEFDRPDQAVQPTRLPVALLELAEVLQRRERLRLLWKDLSEYKSDPNVCLLLKEIEREGFFLDLWITVARSRVLLRAGR